MKIKTVVFDFGGVLVDWNPRYLFSKIFQDPAEMDFFLENICTDEWNLQQDKGRSLADATQILQQQFPEHQELIGLYYSRWEEMLNGSIPENVSVLRQLKGKIPLYGLTNWSAETFPIALERFEFFELFDGIVVSGTEKMIKPEKEIYHLLLDRYQLESTSTLFIDDNPKNIKAANEMGMQTIHLQPTTNLLAEIKQLGIL